MEKTYRPKEKGLRTLAIVVAVMAIVYAFWTGRLAFWGHWGAVSVEGAAACAMFLVLIYLGLRVRNEKVTINEQGITYRSAWRRERFFPWKEITAHTSHGRGLATRYRVYWGARFLQFDALTFDRLDDLWPEVIKRATGARSIAWFEPCWWARAAGPWGLVLALIILSGAAYLVSVAVKLVAGIIGLRVP